MLRTQTSHLRLSVSSTSWTMGLAKKDIQLSTPFITGKLVLIMVKARPSCSRRLCLAAALSGPAVLLEEEEEEEKEDEARGKPEAVRRWSARRRRERPARRRW